MGKNVTSDTILWLNGTWAALMIENGDNVLEYAASAAFHPLHWILTKWVLKKWWGITDRKSLLAQIEDKSGYCTLRSNYDKAVAQHEIWSLPDEAFHEKLEVCEFSQTERSNLIAVHVMSKHTELDTIIAYDYSRAIMLCEYGYSCGYLKLNESINMAIKIGQKMQACFSSWYEMNESYLTGYLFWLIVAEQDVVENWKSRVKALEKVQAMVNGPYSLDWKMPLTDKST